MKSLLLMILSHFSPPVNVLEGNASSGYKVLCQEMIPSRECPSPSPPHLCLLLSSPGFVTSEEDMRDGRLEHQPPIRQQLPPCDQTCDILPPCVGLSKSSTEWVGGPRVQRSPGWGQGRSWTENLIGVSREAHSGSSLAAGWVQSLFALMVIGFISILVMGIILPRTSE